MDAVSFKDAVYLIVLAVGVAGSHFMQRARIMVLEERMRGHSEEVKRIFDTLQRIEHKLDDKADK